ncbi:DUF4375 domain-containing protein [Duganella sp. BJB1802]|uniref:DMP19 family protein n=1 Tax=Duganella sp. BJB1802 TaxID=2744575 RepID=UPI0015939B62|nr:DUF4375 domain-containing protein [Duganella sp. BJB1802]NVD70929.1 DUF4375 domain-containing protein [Duganella sp. BJB1802]
MAFPLTIALFSVTIAMTTPEQPLTLEELKAMNMDMHKKSPAELQAILERTLASLPKEAQENIRRIQAEAAARPPRPELTEISDVSLSSLTSEDLDLAVYRYITNKLAKADNQRTALLALPRGLQVFYLSFIVEAEVMNGGLHQFFWNAADLADLVAPALRELDAMEASKLFEQAALIGHDEQVMRSEFRNDGWDEYSASNQASKLGKLDKSFCTQAEKFRTMRAAYLKSHEAQLVGCTLSG